jgi:tryptophan synthase alpha chain
LAGFGISIESQLKELAPYYNGFIIGSKIIELIENDDFKSMEELLSVFKES